MIWIKPYIEVASQADQDALLERQWRARVKMNVERRERRRMQEANNISWLLKRQAG